MLNRSISVVCPVRSMVNYGHTDHVRICCGCVPASTVIYGLLQSVAVDYGRNEIFEHVENRATHDGIIIIIIIIIITPIWQHITE